MRMKRSMYKMDNDKHKKLMKKLIADDMTFNEFINRLIFLYLEGEYTLDDKQDNEKE